MKLTFDIIAKIKILYPEYSAITGPYIEAKSRRQYYSFYDKTKKIGELGRSHKVLASRLILELKLDRRLIGDEEADHIDNNKLNDDSDNLQVLSKEQNIAKMLKLRINTVARSCNYCSKLFIANTKQKKQLLVYCSKSCNSSSNNVSRGWK